MKCVMIINPNLPLGLIANTSVILGIALGDNIKDIRGKDLVDLEGNKHIGVVHIPVPILQSTPKEIKEIYKKAEEKELFVADFIDVAQKCKTYNEYIDTLPKTSIDEIGFLGIIIYGNKKIINKLTGNLPLLR